MTDTNQSDRSDVVSNLHAARVAALEELKACEERAEAIRAELGMIEEHRPVVHPMNGVSLVAHAEPAAPRRKPARKAKVAAKATAKPKVAKPARAKSARLARRSPEQIAEAVGKIVKLVGKSKEGMRAEDIRKELDLLPKEMPRLLKEGVKSKRLKSTGQKRATTYMAA